MKAFKNKLILVLLVLLILIVVIPLIVFLILARQKDQPGGHIPSPIIALLPERVTYWPVNSCDVLAFPSSRTASYDMLIVTIPHSVPIQLLPD